MKNLIIIFILLSFYFSSNAQNNNKMTLEKRIAALEDRAALKNLVDSFSILADIKATQQQTLLFTENAVVETIMNKQKGAALTGRKQIGDAFENFLSLFETVYHINGQQTIVLDGDHASGTSYCLVTLIGMENGKKMKTNFGIYYNDEFVREHGRWLIAKRTSNFVWQDKQEASH